MLQSAGLQVAAISADTLESHREYSDKLELPFPLLGDTQKDVCKLYDVLTPILGIQRTVFVIGKDGTILYRQKGAPTPPDILKSIDL